MLSLGTTGCGKTDFQQYLLMSKLGAMEGFFFADGKRSIFSVSRRKAKKRLMAGGLTPSKAAQIVRHASASAFPAVQLIQDMKQRKRLGKRWFPWDVLITTSEKKKGKRES